jgi:hypothetical protein
LTSATWQKTASLLPQQLLLRLKIDLRLQEPLKFSLPPKTPKERKKGKKAKKGQRAVSSNNRERGTRQDLLTNFEAENAKAPQPPATSMTSKKTEALQILERQPGRHKWL